MLPRTSIAELTHIVLVEPQDSLNIGSIARAMMNFGFARLVLVKPNQFSIEKALITGRWAEEILRSTVVYDSIDEALRDMHDVVGFSSQSRPRRGEPMLLPDWLSTLSDSSPRRLAVLFGREDTGLTVEAIEQCRLLVRIPSQAAYPSLNLAQSALVVMYELSRLGWNTIERSSEQLPSWNQYAQLDRLCGEVMVASGFHRGEERDPTAATVKNMLRRITMNEREMRIMLALFNRIRITFERAQGTGE